MIKNKEASTDGDRPQAAHASQDIYIYQLATLRTTLNILKYVKLAYIILSICLSIQGLGCIFATVNKKVLCATLQNECYENLEDVLPYTLTASITA